MMPLPWLVLAATALSLAMPPVAAAQAAATGSDALAVAAVPPLFARDSPLVATFSANLRRLRADRDSNPPWRQATITYTSDTGRVVIQARARTRGIWRLKNCAFPPLRLDFPGKSTRGTVFHHLGRPKLVNFCKDTDQYDQYILQEFQLYRIYQLLTPVSYRVRLLKMTYVDSASGRTDATRWAFVAEDPERLATRMQGTVMKTQGATADDLEPEQLALAYLFEYMIGNTDFSFNRLHNTQLIGTSDGRLLPVAYDFDYAGAVNAEYAVPDPHLRIRSVRTRMFRGYCAISAEYPKLLPLFRDKKPAIYALYRDQIGQLLDARRVRETLAYFDEFYDLIATTASAQSAFLDSCVGPH